MFVPLPHLRQQQRTFVLVLWVMFMCLHQHRDLLAFHCFSVLVHIVHYSRSCPVITTNRWNLSNAAPPFFMLLFLFRCRCVQVLSQSPANRDCKGGAGTGGGAGAETTSRPVGQQHAQHISVSTQRAGLDAVVTAAGFHTLCDLMLQRSASDVTSSLWKHVSLLSARSFSERTQPQ